MMTPAAPPPMSEDEMIESATDYFVTESVLDVRAAPGEIVRLARLRKMTASITFHINEGGLAKIVVTQKTKLNAKNANATRKVIGMDYVVREL